jgi:hypothetical protein
MCVRGICCSRLFAGLHSRSYATPRPLWRVIRAPLRKRCLKTRWKCAEGAPRVRRASSVAKELVKLLRPYHVTPPHHESDRPASADRDDARRDRADREICAVCGVRPDDCVRHLEQRAILPRPAGARVGASRTCASAGGAVVAHREWMTRSYAVVLIFMEGRVLMARNAITSSRWWCTDANRKEPPWRRSRLSRAG